MSDDSSSQSQAISVTWPNAKQLLCVNHVLQSFWTWRQVLILKVKDLVYAKSEQQLVERFNQLFKDSVAVTYPRFLQHVNNYWPRKYGVSLFGNTC